jgi:uncharacterized protein
MEGAVDAKACTQLIARYFKAYESADMDAIEGMFDPNCVWKAQNRDDLSGPDYYGAAQDLFNATTARKINVLHMIAEDDHVAVELELELDFGSKIYRNRYHDVFVIADGAIYEVRQYTDTAALNVFSGRDSA